MRTKTEHR